RELENILERAVALCGSAEIKGDDLRLRPAALEAAESAEGTEGGAAGEALPDYLDRAEREAILGALAKTGFNRTAGANPLGVTFRALRYRMQRLGIREPE